MREALVEKKLFSVEEYFELEEQSELRHEYYRGEFLAMAGGTTNHNLLVDNIKTGIKDRFKSKGCKTFTENVKLGVIKDVYFTYPDVMLTCNPFDLRAKYYIQYPSLIVEVLSDSSEKTDRGKKLLNYRRMPSVQYYLLVSQYSCCVELFSRVEESDLWTYQVFDTMEAIISFSKLAFEISISSIYDGIDLGSLEEDANSFTTN